MSNAITCIVRDLDLGGVPRLYIAVLGHLVRSGVHCRLVSAGGTLAPVAHARGIELVDVDWGAGRRAALRTLSPVLDEAAPVVIVVDPATVGVLPGAAAAGPVGLGFHSRPSHYDRWFARGPLQRFADLAGSLLRAGDGHRALAMAEHVADQVATLLAVDRAAVTLLPQAVDVTNIELHPPPDELRRVLCLCRLSPEKKSSVDAAARLVAHRLAAGRPAHLDVVGDGSWRGEAEALCRTRLPQGAFAFLGATDDPIGTIAAADVVVGSGLALLESVAAGRPAVAVRLPLDTTSPIGPPVTPTTFAAVSAAGGGSGLAPAWDETDVWAALDALTAADLVELRGALAERHSIAATAAVLTSFGPSPVATSPVAARALGRLAAELEDELDEVRAVADALWADRPT